MAPKKILTVDDSALIRDMLRLSLEEGGYEVMEAVDGEDALRKLAEGSVDMVITDLNMPRLDGIALIREIRRLPNHRFTPIIMLTTESEADKKLVGRSAGASGWVVKPFQPEHLLSVVHMVLP